MANNYEEKQKTGPPYLTTITTTFVLNTLCWAAFTLIIPIVLLIMLPLRIYKTVIILLARSRSSLSNTLQGYDSIFAIDELYTRPFAANATFIILEKSIELKELQSLFKNRVLDVREDGKYKYSRLRHTPENYGGFYFWKQVEVDIKSHIRLVHCKDLNKELGLRMTSGFTPTTSPWELLLLDWGGKSVLLFRLHHVLGDGYTANHIVDLIVGGKSEYIVGVERVVGIAERARLLYTCPSRLASLYLAAFTRRGRDHFTRPKSTSSGLVSYTSLDLERLRRLRRRAGVHFATLGMCLLTGALRRHYKNNNPLHVSVMHSLPRPGHPLDRMVNHWAVGLFRIPFATRHSIERLREAEEYFNEYNSAGFKEIIHYHMPLFNLLPSPLVRLFFRTNFGTGVGFTSLPGIGGEGSVCGGRVEGMWKVFGFQWSQTALAAAMYSTCGKVGLTLYANEGVIGSQRELDRIAGEYVREELEELERGLLCE